MDKDVIYVEWYDASSTDEWTPLSEVDGTPKLCQSIGWLVKKTSTDISIANSREGDEFSCIIHIPRVCIRYVRPIDVQTRGRVATANTLRKSKKKICSVVLRRPQRHRR